jgi:hypothetical protein
MNFQTAPTQILDVLNSNEEWLSARTACNGDRERAVW